MFYQVLDLEFSNFLNSNQPFTANITLLNPASFEQPWAPNYTGGVNDPITVFKQNIAAGTTNFVTPTAAYALDPHIRNGYVQQYNLSVQRQLPWRSSLQVAYVGTVGRKLSLATESNPGIFNPAAPTAAINNTRPYDPGVLQSILPVQLKQQHELQRAAGERKPSALRWADHLEHLYVFEVVRSLLVGFDWGFGVKPVRSAV